MAKQVRTNKRKKAQAAKGPAAPAPVTRRDVLGTARNGAIVIALLAAVGYGGMRWYQGYADEHDLTRIGQGTPAVVQVHDRQCPSCMDLQREAKKALGNFNDDELVYVVADLNQEAGAAFAAKFNVGRTTLVLMDGDGLVTQVLRGPQTRAQLRKILDVHLKVHGAAS